MGFRIGAYRVDFVLNAPDGRRLTIECDGDAYDPGQWASDVRRQAVLERVGNCVFVRIRGSVFVREPTAAMRPVWQRIDEPDITPGSPTGEHGVTPGSPVGEPDITPGPPVGEPDITPEAPAREPDVTPGATADRSGP